MNCAIISLPLPLSPVMKTDASVVATRRARAIASRKVGAEPMPTASSAPTVAPARSASVSSAVSTVGLPVITMTIASGFVSRAAPSNCMPAAPLMYRSTRTMSNERRCRVWSASSPRLHTSTWYPSNRSAVAQLSRSVCSSSTTRIRTLAFIAWFSGRRCDMSRPSNVIAAPRGRGGAGRRSSVLGGCIGGCNVSISLSWSSSPSRPTVARHGRSCNLCTSLPSDNSLLARRFLGTAARPRQNRRRMLTSLLHRCCGGALLVADRWTCAVQRHGLKLESRPTVLMVFTKVTAATAAALAFAPLAALPGRTWARQPSGAAAPRLLASRADLTQRLTQLRQMAESTRPPNGLSAEISYVEGRLHAGDFRAGDRLVIQVEEPLPVTPGGGGGAAPKSPEQQLTDTFTVNGAQELTLPLLGLVPLRGVLRSELETYLTAQIATRIRNPEVHARALISVAVSGGVQKPGFYAVPLM